jgi:methionine sulfoxide reductase heme-binding subunit
MTTSASPHLFWITSRAAGIVALVLASLAVSLGLLMSTKLLRRRAPDLIAVHEILSLATIVAILVHGLTLLGDQYLHPSLADISIPFASGYQTVWTSLGIIAGWSLALLGLSYYARRRIGSARWRKLHRFTALAWLAGLVHSLGEGSDAGQIWFLAMTAIVVVPAIALLVIRHLRPTAPATRAPATRAPAPRGAAAHTPATHAPATRGAAPHVSARREGRPAQGRQPADRAQSRDLLWSGGSDTR